jgi:hypothetical protein
MQQERRTLVATAANSTGAMTELLDFQVIRVDQPSWYFRPKPASRRCSCCRSAAFALLPLVHRAEFWLSERLMCVGHSGSSSDVLRKIDIGHFHSLQKPGHYFDGEREQETARKQFPDEDILKKLREIARKLAAIK